VQREKEKKRIKEEKARQKEEERLIRRAEQERWRQREEGRLRIMKGLEARTPDNSWVLDHVVEPVGR
jgi:hypothetical protein